MELLDRVSTDPNVMVGKPLIKGTRIPVETILAHLSVTPDVQDLLKAYPRLTVEDEGLLRLRRRTDPEVL